MRYTKIFIILFTIFLTATFSSHAQIKRKKTVKKSSKNKVAKTVSSKIPQPVKEDFRIIAEGAMSSVEKPFVYIVRDAETFQYLQKLAENLPEVSTLDFTKEAVVAVFSGEKPTAGFAVSIGKNGEKIKIETVAPPKDSVTAQIITSPFKIAVVPVSDEKVLRFEAAKEFLSGLNYFKVSKGTFSYSGGFAPRERKFDVEGTVTVSRYKDFITAHFSMSAKGDKNLMIADTVSGLMQGDEILINRVDAGTFSEMPRPSLNVKGKISDTNLSLKFEPNPTNISDGFEARGNIEALKTKAAN